MSGIVINIDPVLLRLGSFELRWYAVAIAMAVVTAVLISLYRSRKRGIEGQDIITLAVWVVIAGVIGARLAHVIDHWEHYINAPQQIIGFQGLGIWGALIGGGIAATLFSWRKKTPLLRLLDTIVPGVIVALIIGRIGCIVNGDAYGAVTNLPWAFIYINPASSIPPSLYAMPTHPYPVYEMLWNGVSLALILGLERKVKKEGVVFLGFVSVYSVGRIVLSFVRMENTFFGSLQGAQVIGIVILGIALLAMIYLIRRPVFGKRKLNVDNSGPDVPDLEEKTGIA